MVRGKVIRQLQLWSTLKRKECVQSQGQRDASLMCLTGSRADLTIVERCCLLHFIKNFTEV